MAAEVRLLHEPQEDEPNASASVGMSLRTADKTSESQRTGDDAGMSLRTARQTASASVGMSLRTADKSSESQRTGGDAGMSLRTARERVEVSSLPEAERVEGIWTNLRVAMDEKFPGDVGGKEDLLFASLASYLSLRLKNKTVAEVENILHDEFTAV